MPCRYQTRIFLDCVCQIIRNNKQPWKMHLPLWCLFCQVRTSTRILQVLPVSHKDHVYMFHVRLSDICGRYVSQYWGSGTCMLYGPPFCLFGMIEIINEWLREKVYFRCRWMKIIHVCRFQSLEKMTPAWCELKIKNHLMILLDRCQRYIHYKPIPVNRIWQLDGKFCLRTCTIEWRWSKVASK